MLISELETATKLSYIQPHWPAPPCVKAYQTTRQGGFAREQHASFSLGGADNASLEDIKTNRQKLITDLGLEASPPIWLQQVHGNRVVDLNSNAKTRKSEQNSLPPPPSALHKQSRAGSPPKEEEAKARNFIADASFSTETALVCAVQTADCLPILLCDRAGTAVAAIHGGWKSILAGIIEITVAALPVKSTELLAWLGPAIGPTKFEVGEEVYRLFVTYDEQAEGCFTQKSTDKWLANLYELAKQRLQSAGVEAIYGGNYCTYSQKDLFFSYRRDATQTGRMASLIWLD